MDIAYYFAENESPPAPTPALARLRGQLRVIANHLEQRALQSHQEYGQGKTPYWKCCLCDAAGPHIDDVQHDPLCPVTLTRAALAKETSHAD